MTNNQETATSPSIRLCKQCGNEWQWKRGHRFGSAICSKKCERSRYRASYPERHLESNRRYAANHQERVLVTKARARAKEKGVPFNLKFTDITIPDLCPYLGIPLEKATGSNTAQPNSPSIDRVVPEKGYTVGNVEVISHLANTMKSNATKEQLVAFAKGVLAKFNT